MSDIFVSVFCTKLFDIWNEQVMLLNISPVKPVLSGHLWDTEKVDL
jgi:hypothetical protein